MPYLPWSVRPAVVTRLRAAGCVFAEDEADLLLAEARTPAGLAALVARRAAGEPLEQVLGWVAFAGLRIALEPGVFVPRQRTAFLVDEAVARVRAAGSSARVVRVVDLCCGSGAVGAAIAAALDGVPDRVEVDAVDLDPVAVRCARRNLAVAGGRAYQGDLDAPLPASLRGGVDLLVANAPYVPSDEVALMPPEARLHEPRVALDGGRDGLDVLRRVITLAPGWLAPGGSVLVEASTRQAPGLAEVVAATGLVPRVTRSDARGATVVVGTAPTAGATPR